MKIDHFCFHLPDSGPSGEDSSTKKESKWGFNSVCHIKTSPCTTQLYNTYGNNMQKNRVMNKIGRPIKVGEAGNIHPRCRKGKQEKRKGKPLAGIAK